MQLLIDEIVKEEILSQNIKFILAMVNVKIIEMGMKTSGYCLLVVVLCSQIL